MKRANLYLNNAVYDGKGKNPDEAWMKHISRFRESFFDLEASGNPISQEMQVEKLVQSFQHPQLVHISTIINTTAQYSNDFNQAVAFITSELANLKLKNRARVVAGISAAEGKEPTSGDSSPPDGDTGSEDVSTESTLEGAPQEEESAEKLEQLEKELELLQAKIKKAKRKQADASTREIGSIKVAKVVGGVPASLLKAPKRGLVTTQRAALYSTTTRPSKSQGPT